MDCKFVKDHINEVRKDDAINESICQIAFADRILLNKKDLVTASELKELQEEISSINSFAEQHVTERSKVCSDPPPPRSAWQDVRDRRGPQRTPFALKACESTLERLVGMGVGCAVLGALCRLCCVVDAMCDGPRRRPLRGRCPSRR